MGGEGAMMAANQSLKSNRGMLSKRKKNRFSLVTNSEGKTEYNLPQATEEDIRLLRKKLQKETRQNKRKQLAVIALIVVFSFIGVMYLI